VTLTWVAWDLARLL